MLGKLLKYDFRSMWKQFAFIWPAALALALVNLTPQQNLDAITIGTLMVLVPGRALTNAMWEIMAGDIISGVNRTAEALLTAAAIALGVVAALAVGL